MVDGAYLGGVLLTVATAFTNALAFTLQKVGHHRAAAASVTTNAASSRVGRPTESTAFGTSAATPPHKTQSVTRQPLWWLGIACILLAAVGSAAVFSLVGQSTASALQVQAVAYAAVLSGTVLREPFSWVDACVTVLIVAGAATSAVSAAAAGNAVMSLNEALVLLARPASYLTAASVGVTGASGFLFVIYANRSRSRASDPAATLGSPKDSIRAAELATRTLLASLFSALSGLCTKILMIGITASLTGQGVGAIDCLRVWQWWLSLVGQVLSFTAQMAWVNSALAVFPSLEVIPLYQACATILGIGSGFVFLDEAEWLPRRALATFGIGACLSVAGVSLLLVKSHLLRVYPTTGVKRVLQRIVATVTCSAVLLPASTAAPPPSHPRTDTAGEKDSDRLLPVPQPPPASVLAVESDRDSSPTRGRRPSSLSIASLGSRRSVAIPMRREPSRVRFASFALGGVVGGGAGAPGFGVREGSFLRVSGGAAPASIGQDHTGKSGAGPGSGWPIRHASHAGVVGVVGADEALALSNFASRASFAGFFGLPDAELDAALDCVDEVAGVAEDDGGGDPEDDARVAVGAGGPTSRGR